MPKKTTLANKRKRLRITPITRKQARSYNMTATPNGRVARANGMGVTAISAVNGKGAYDADYRRRYANTLEALRGRTSTPNAGDAMFYYKNANKKASQPKKAAPKAAARPKFDARYRAGLDQWTREQKAAPKRAKKKLSAKQQAVLLRGRQKLANIMCATIRSPRPKFLGAAPTASKKAKANRARGRKNGVASYISNARRNVMSFSEWNKTMKATRRPRSSAAKKRRAKRNPLAQALANARRRRARKSAKRPASTRRRARANYAPGVRKVDVRAYSRGPAKKASAKKASAVQKSMDASLKKMIRAAKSAAPLVRPSKKAAAKKAASKRAKAKANKRKMTRGGVYMKNLAQAAANRSPRRPRARRPHARRHHARHASRNGMASYISNIGVSEIMEIVKQGAIIGGGLVAHKVLTNLVVSNVDALKSMKFGKSVAGIAIAAVGIPAAKMFVPGALGKDLAIGMGAALFHTVLVEVLSSAGQSSIASMLGDYTEQSQMLPAAGVGSYYQFAPGQSYDGMGSYYEFAPGQSYDGMGEYIEQGASGFGAFEQAAAGFGSPMLAQAAAGVGEYIVQGAQGIGEYEEVVPEYTAPSVIREGISPSLGSAEYALSMAEAAAGVGGFGNTDAGLQQIVYPKGQSLDVHDDPGASRSGMFFGGNGVFGP
jgi:hypothetical protein